MVSSINTEGGRYSGLRLKVRLNEEVSKRERKPEMEPTYTFCLNQSHVMTFRADQVILVNNMMLCCMCICVYEHENNLTE